ncbi:hypothetical protein Lal_00035238 [Lupinus albus]|nr:hypothetical protein Lal_00035238 [Lupinus albus]
MTRGNTCHLHPINPEIDRTYHRTLPFHSVADNDSVSGHSVQYSDFVHYVAYSDYEHFEHFVHSENMAQPPTPPGPRERTLRELVALDFTYDSFHIQYPNEDFNGLAGEDPHKYLKEFHIVFSTLKAFSHSVLYYLALGSITSWGDLKKKFLGPLQSEKIFNGLGINMVKAYMSIGGDSKGCVQILEQLILQYFYEGLNNMDMSIIDAASGGALGGMTPFEARSLIEKMASNSQQFNARSNDDIVVR